MFKHANQHVVKEHMCVGLTYRFSYARLAYTTLTLVKPLFLWYCMNHPERRISRIMSVVFTEEFKINVCFQQETVIILFLCIPLYTFFALQLVCHSSCAVPIKRVRFRLQLRVIRSSC